MSNNPIFAARLKSGLLHYHTPELVDRYLSGFKDDQLFKVIYKPFKVGDQLRSVAANSYYWTVVIGILKDEWGYTKDEMHDALGLMFRIDRSRIPPTIERTSTMSSRRFWEYIREVQVWAGTEYNIKIPNPNEVDFD